MNLLPSLLELRSIGTINMLFLVICGDISIPGHHIPHTASPKKTIPRIALTGHEVEAYKHMSISLRLADMIFRILFTIRFPLIHNTKQSATICPEAFVHHYR